MGSTVMDRSGTLTGTGPVQVSYARPPQANRIWAIPIIGTYGKELALIPHFIALAVLGLVNTLIHLVAWVPVLTKGEYPQWAYNWSTGTLRWAVRVFAFWAGLTDKYPPFSMSGEDDYPVQVSFQYPSNPSKLFAIPVVGYLIRYVLLIPHIIALYVLVILTYLSQLVLWIPVLFTGQYPEWGYQLVGGTIRWATRIAGYAFGLTDEYPPFQLAE